MMDECIGYMGLSGSPLLASMLAILNILSFLPRAGVCVLLVFVFVHEGRVGSVKRMGIKGLAVAHDGATLAHSGGRVPWCEMNGV